jgi:hypothetical protein
MLDNTNMKREPRGKAVHGTGAVARSDGNDTDCGAASSNPYKLLWTEDPEKITCKRCLKIRAQH